MRGWGTYRLWGMGTKHASMGKPTGCRAGIRDKACGDGRTYWLRGRDKACGDGENLPVVWWGMGTKHASMGKPTGCGARIGDKACGDVWWGWGQDCLLTLLA